MDDPAQRAQRTYDSASDHYDDAPLGFWDRTGRRTVERLGLPAGARVLGVPCGAGASALAAARTVGPDGRVVGVDVATRLLDLARAKADAAGLANLELRAADMRTLEPDDGGFDAVVCVFGIFFVPDPVAQTRRLWNLVRPGGVLAITTWGPGPFEPGAAALWRAVDAVRPDLVRAYEPWASLTTPDSLRGLFAGAGIDGAEAELVEDAQPLREGEDFWTIVQGTGYRNTTDALSEPDRARVHEQVVEAMSGVPAITTSAIHGVARRR
jgi:ubiquinone/menaquinone biosynthesis C-methylase UbiE